MSAFEKVDFPAPAGPVTKTAYLIVRCTQGSGGEARPLMSGPLCPSFKVKGVVAGEK